MYCSCYVTLPPSTRKKEGKKREGNRINVGIIFKLSFLCLCFVYFDNIQRKLKKEKTSRITNACT
jgi:hypothetical protein